MALEGTVMPGSAAFAEVMPMMSGEQFIARLLLLGFEKDKTLGSWWIHEYAEVQVTKGWEVYVHVTFLPARKDGSFRQEYNLTTDDALAAIVKHLARKRA